ncbi:retrotransposon-related protein [Tanacetum coccineum]
MGLTKRKRNASKNPVMWSYNTDTQENGSAMKMKMITEPSYVLEGKSKTSGISWSPPPLGRLKMNTDGAHRPNEHHVGSGIDSTKLHPTELHGIHKGLKLLDKLGYKGAILETDIQGAFQELADKNKITIMHIGGDNANKCADGLANLAIRKQVKYEELEGLSTANLLNCFLFGLCEDIRCELFLLKLATLHEAIGMAKLVEDKLTTSRFSNPQSPTVRPFNNPFTQPQLVTRNNPLPIKRLSPTDMEARREKEKLSKEQASPYANEATEPTTPILAAPSLPRFDEPVIYPSPTDTLPSISLHAFTRQFVPRTLKVADLFLLPIYGADIVLGVEWLATLGPIVFDYKNLYMKINHNGTLIHFPGLVHPTFSQISFSQLQKAETQDAVVSFFHLQVVDSPETTSSLLVHPTPTPILDDALKQLMVKYATIFSVPKSLPPTRPFDHRIRLLPNTSPVNVKPYRYPHFQKAEMERLISLMLSKGIVRPSNSTFSSPVLLVKKKDGTWRFGVDYRAVNAVKVKDSIPIPTVDELLHELHGATIFSKLDLRAGYH